MRHRNIGIAASVSLVLQIVAGRAIGVLSSGASTDLGWLGTSKK